MTPQEWDIVASDAVPPGKIMLVSPRRIIRVTMPDGREVQHAESVAEWARRCAVLRGMEAES
jgi:hypothetical protein